VLEVLGIRLTEAHIGIMNEGAPAELGVDLSIERITKVDESDVTLEFNYSVQYQPNLAVVNIRGIAFCRDTVANIKKLLETWRKKKEVSGEIAGPAINMINANVGVNSLFLMRPFDLAPHFMPPPIFAQGKAPVKKKEKKIAKKKRKRK